MRRSSGVRQSFCRRFAILSLFVLYISPTLCAGILSKPINELAQKVESAGISLSDYLFFQHIYPLVDKLDASVEGHIDHLDQVAFDSIEQLSAVIDSTLTTVDSIIFGFSSDVKEMQDRLDALLVTAGEMVIDIETRFVQDLRDLTLVFVRDIVVAEELVIDRLENMVRTLLPGRATRRIAKARFGEVPDSRDFLHWYTIYRTNAIRQIPKMRRLEDVHKQYVHLYDYCQDICIYLTRIDQVEIPVYMARDLVLFAHRMDVLNYAIEHFDHQGITL